METDKEFLINSAGHTIELKKKKKKEGKKNKKQDSEKTESVNEL